MIANDEVVFARGGEIRATGDELDEEATRVLESVQITRTAPQPVLRDISTTTATPTPVAAATPTPTLGGGITFNAPPPGSAVVADVVPSPVAVVAGDEVAARARDIDWRAIARAAWPWLLIAAVSYLGYRVATGDGGADRWT